MKSIAKLMLVGTFALATIAISAAPSEAAKRHRHHAKSCELGSHCSASCANGNCTMKVCGTDGKWYDAFLTPVCLGATCPKACR
jgi:hypothetical protein